MLSGDYTCLPEDGIDRLAAALAGAKLERRAGRGSRRRTERLKLDMPGVAPSDIAAAVMAAVEPAG